MSETLAIPDLVDAIAESGYENYGFLRCLNREFHKMWYMMIAYVSDISKLDEENDREELDLYREKTRVLVLDVGRKEFGLSLEKCPNIRYLRLVDYCPNGETLHIFKFLRVLDFNWGDYYISDLPKPCKTINCESKINILSKTVSELKLSESDKKIIEKLKEVNPTDISVILAKTLTNQYLRLVVKRNSKKYLHLYDLCDHIEIEICYDSMSNIVELVKKNRFKNLKISVIDHREQYREEKYCLKYGICPILNECELTEQDLESAEKMFDPEKVDSLEITFA